MRIKLTYREGATVVVDDPALLSVEPLDAALTSAGQVNLDAAVETLGLGTRATNTLNRAHIRTIRQLLGVSFHDLALLRGLGIAALTTIQHTLAARGLILGSDSGTGPRPLREQLSLTDLPELAEPQPTNGAQP